MGNEDILTAVLAVEDAWLWGALLGPFQVLGQPLPFLYLCSFLHMFFSMVFPGQQVVMISARWQGHASSGLTCMEMEQLFWTRVCCSSGVAPGAPLQTLPPNTGPE